MDRRYQGAGPASPPRVRPQACQCAVQQFKMPLARARFGQVHVLPVAVPVVRAWSRGGP